MAEFSAFEVLVGIMFGVGTFLAKELNQGKTERKKMELPAPLKPEVIPVATAISMFQDGLKTLANSILSIQLGQPKFHVEETEKLNSQTIPNMLVVKLQNELAELQDQFKLVKIDELGFAQKMSLEIDYIKNELMPSCPEGKQKECTDRFSVLEGILKMKINGHETEDI